MQARTVPPEHIHTLIQAALRAAATAPTVFDALDVTGAALRTIQEWSDRSTESDLMSRNEPLPLRRSVTT